MENIPTTEKKVIKISRKKLLVKVIVWIILFLLIICVSFSIARAKFGYKYYHVTVLSPKQSDTWAKGTMQTIKWQDSNTIGCLIWFRCAYDIRLIPLDWAQKFVFYAAPVPVSFTIATGVSGSSYNWMVGKNINKLDDIRGNVVPDGLYTVEICQTTSHNCGDGDFKIVNGGIAN